MTVIGDGPKEAAGYFARELLRRGVALLGQGRPSEALDCFDELLNALGYFD